MPPRDDDATAGNLHDVLTSDVRSLHGLTKGQGEAPHEHELRAIAPRPVPCLVLSLAAKDPAGVATALGKIPDMLDDTVARYPVKIELRADLLPDLKERMTAAALVLRLGVPIIVTLRARQEGGATALTEPERQRFFLSMVSALRDPPPAGSLVDIEAAAIAADPQGWAQVLAHAREKGFQVMLSHHDLDGTPDDDHGLLPSEGLLDTVPGGPAAIWKAATKVNSWSDELELLSALRRGNAATRRAAIMGMGTSTSRLVAPFFAAPLVYAAIDAGENTAPGQLPFADLARTWTRWGVQVDDAALAAPADEHGYPPRWVLLGRPAWHSLSPAMHNAAARSAGRAERYLPLELPDLPGDDERERFDETMLALRAIGVTGGNATIPFKRLLAATADRLEGDADALGVANTFRFDDGRLVATNTDTAATRRALEEAGIDVANSKVLVIGAGGSATAAAYALRDARSLSVTNRSTDKADALATLIAAHVAQPPRVVPWADREGAAREADVIVHCTSIGMTGGPAPDESPLSADCLGANQSVLDLVYVPRRTPLLAAAEKAGARGVDGTTVLLHQAVAAYRFWTGTDPSVDEMRRALDAADRIPLPETVRSVAPAIAAAEVDA